MDKNIVFNKENFSKFLNNFDSLHKKFFFMLDDGEYQKLIDNNTNDYHQCVDNIYSTIKNKNVFNRWNVDLQCRVYDVINTVYFQNDYPDLKNPGILTDEEIVGVVFEKIIYEYVNIAGVSDLFNPEFFKFEKMMHEEYRDNQKPYYRDHYIHQARNMYEMFSFLDEDEEGIGLIDKCITLQFDQNRDIGEFLNNAIKEEIQNLNVYEKNMFEDVCNLINKSTKKSISIDDYIIDFFKHYIIYATSIVSSLLHDIGYPLDFLSRVEAIYENFIPTSKVFVEVKDDFVHIYNVLKDSLLFQSVDIKEIKDKLLKHNHGAMSAIIILMYYYQNNPSNKLSPVEQAVIELSAFVIYNHTVKYSFQTLESERLYKNIFVKGPLSYLFRLCDDIQEWDRTYYEISDKGNIFICPKCKMPMINTKIDNMNNTSVRNYICACSIKSDEGKLSSNVAGVRLGDFKYRRIMNAIACNQVKVEYEDDILNINIDYGLDNLLQLAFYNVNYAHYRQSEIESLRRSLMLEADFPYGYVNGLATYNPVYIKCEILKSIESLRFDKKLVDRLKADLLQKDLKKDQILKILQIFYNTPINQKSIKLASDIIKILFDDEKLVMTDIFESQLKLYLYLMYIGDCLEGAALEQNLEEKYINSLINGIIIGLINIFKIKSAQVEELIHDYLYNKINFISYEVYSNQIKNRKISNVKDDYVKMRCLYEKMGKSKNPELLKNKVEAYTDFRITTNDYYKFIYNNNKSDMIVDFFSDYHIFYLLAKKKNEVNKTLENIIIRRNAYLSTIEQLTTNRIIRNIRHKNNRGATSHSNCRNGRIVNGIYRYRNKYKNNSNVRFKSKRKF